MSAVLTGVAGLCWIAAGFRLVRWRGSGNAQRSLCLSLLSLAAALTSQLPSAYFWLGDVAGVPNIAVPVGHALVLIAAWAATAVLIYSTDSRIAARSKVRRRLVSVIGADLLMFLLFFVSPRRPQTLQYVALYGQETLVTAYYLVYLTMLGIGAADIGRLCWRYAMRARRELLRVGLHLIALSAVDAILYVGYKGVFVLNRRLALHLPLGMESDVSRGLMVGGTLLVLAGTTVFFWGSQVGLSSISTRYRAYRSYRRLFPLWKALYEVTPSIALYPPSTPLLDALTFHDLDFRLHRRVIEISDGWLAVRPYVDARLASQARAAAQGQGLVGLDLAAAEEAAILAAGVAAKASGVQSGGRNSDHDLAMHQPIDELAWLVRIATAYQGTGQKPFRVPTEVAT